jgi:riboflavin synthase
MALPRACSVAQNAPHEDGYLHGGRADADCHRIDHLVDDAARPPLTVLALLRPSLEKQACSSRTDAEESLATRRRRSTPPGVFTGIIETTGLLKARAPRGPGARLLVSTEIASLVVGESISVHGVCLTVHSTVVGGFECDASAETLARSTLGSVPLGGTVHLERALTMGGRLGGHIVTGHVDGRVKLRNRERVGDALKLGFEILDGDLVRYVAPKGSVAIDGVSLTVNVMNGREFEVVIIPHTLVVTTLGHLMPTDDANLEVDILARYVAQLLPFSGDGAPSEDESLLKKLRNSGFM